MLKANWQFITIRQVILCEKKINFWTKLLILMKIVIIFTWFKIRVNESDRVYRKSTVNSSLLCEIQSKSHKRAIRLRIKILRQAIFSMSPKHLHKRHYNRYWELCNFISYHTSLIHSHVEILIPLFIYLLQQIIKKLSVCKYLDQRDMT